MKDDLVYLRHIAGAIKDIEAYTVGGREEFLATKMIQDAVIRNLKKTAFSNPGLRFSRLNNWPLSS